MGTAIGTGFGYLLMGGGIVLLLTSGLGGLWLLVLGWFLAMAAQAEAAQMAARQALSGLHVRDLMASDPVSVPPDMDLGSFVDDVARGTRFSTYPVVDDGNALGLLTFRSVAQVPRDRWDSTRAADCMVPREHVTVAVPDDDAADMLQEVLGSETRRALVLEDEQLRGLLSITDVTRAIQVRAPGERMAQQASMADSR